jgi:hypothetical protein
MVGYQVPGGWPRRPLLPTEGTILAAPLSQRRTPPLRSCSDDAAAFKRETSTYLQTFDPQYRPHDEAPARRPAGEGRSLSPLFIDTLRPISVDTGGGQNLGQPLWIVTLKLMHYRPLAFRRLSCIDRSIRLVAGLHGARRATPAISIDVFIIDASVVIA